MIRLGCVSRASRTACLDSRHVVTWNPSDSSATRTTSRIAGVSSTTRIRGGAVTLTFGSVPIIALSHMSWRALRLLPISTLIAACVASPASAQPAPPTSSGPGAASLLPANPEWVLNFETVEERVEPSEESESVTTLPAWTYLAVRAYRGEWAEVFNPRT